MQTCSQCGSQNSDEARFCSQCGNPLPQQSAVPAAGAG
ncbi:MAG: zinc-ribbon domain-containing protein, partial [Marmoricola sp.]